MHLTNWEKEKKKKKLAVLFKVVKTLQYLNPVGTQKAAIKLWTLRLSRQRTPVPLEQTALPLNTATPLNASDIRPA